MTITVWLEQLIRNNSNFEPLCAEIEREQKKLDPAHKNYKYDSVLLDLLKLRYDIGCMVGVLIEMHGAYLDYAESSEKRIRRLESILLTKAAISESEKSAACVEQFFAAE